MSPEQVRATPLDTRTDIVLVRRRALRNRTGVLPFRGDSPGATFDAILNRVPTTAVRLNPDVPAELERIIDKCLEKDRALRPQHASDIRTDLLRLKRDSDSGRIPPVALTPARKRTRRRMLAVLVPTAGVIAAVGA